MKNSLGKTLTAAGLLLSLGSVARAQTTNVQPPPNNPLISVLQNTIVDTNSSFFGSSSLELRALTQTTVTSYESVISATYYTGTNDHFGIGAEIINGALNVTDAANLTLEYAIPYHNIKFRPILGLGYDFVNRGGTAEGGGGLEVAISQNMFADTEVLYKVPFRRQSGQSYGPAGILRVGVGWKF